jgi:hypothetical protein
MSTSQRRSGRPTVVGDNVHLKILPRIAYDDRKDAVIRFCGAQTELTTPVSISPLFLCPQRPFFIAMKLNLQYLRTTSGYYKLASLYSGCQKNVPVLKRFFLQPYNRATVYTAIP